MRSQYLSAAFAAVNVLAAPASVVPTEARDLDTSYARQMEVVHPESCMSDFETIFRDAWRRVRFTGGSGQGSETRIEARGQLPCNEFGGNNDENSRSDNRDSLDEGVGNNGCNTDDNDGACNNNDDFVNSLMDESDGDCGSEESDEAFLNRADITNEDVVDKSTPSIESALDEERQANREWKDSFKEVLEKLVGGIDGNKAKKRSRDIKQEGSYVPKVKRIFNSLNDAFMEGHPLKPLNAGDPQEDKDEDEKSDDKKKSDDEEKPKTKRAAERSDGATYQEQLEDAFGNIVDQLAENEKQQAEKQQAEKPGFWESLKNFFTSLTPRVYHRGALWP